MLIQGSSNLGLIPEVVTTWEQLESIEVFLGCILPMNDPFVYCNVFFFFYGLPCLKQTNETKQQMKECKQQPERLQHISKFSLVFNSATSPPRSSAKGAGSGQMGCLCLHRPARKQKLQQTIHFSSFASLTFISRVEMNWVVSELTSLCLLEMWRLMRAWEHQQ